MLPREWNQSPGSRSPASQANAEDNLGEWYLKQENWQAAEEVLRAVRKRLDAIEPTARVTGLIAEVEAHLAEAREDMGQPA